MQRGKQLPIVSHKHIIIVMIASGNDPRRIIKLYNRNVHVVKTVIKRENIRLNLERFCECALRDKKKHDLQLYKLIRAE